MRKPGGGEAGQIRALPCLRQRFSGKGARCGGCESEKSPRVGGGAAEGLRVEGVGG